MQKNSSNQSGGTWPGVPSPWESKRPCFDPGHRFPSHLYIPPGGSHTHTCPSCGETVTASSPMTWWS